MLGNYVPGSAENYLLGTMMHAITRPGPGPGLRAVHEIHSNHLPVLINYT